MAKTPKKKSTLKKTKRPAKPTLTDELADMLRGVVVVVEARGGRDRPEVAKAHALLARIGKIAS